jgi:hypothetical protein
MPWRKIQQGAFGSNIDGSEKSKLLVIGKSKNPRTMKNILKESLPVTYEHNKKS